MIIENVPNLKIHKLTKEQYDRELNAGNIENNAIYLTPSEEVDLSNCLRCYKSLTELGLTEPTTTEQVCAAMPVDSMLIMAASQSNITDLPQQWGTLEIVRAEWNYCTASFSQSNSTSVAAYLGKYTTNTTPNWTGWKKVIVELNGNYNMDGYIINNSSDYAFAQKGRITGNGFTYRANWGIGRRNDGSGTASIELRSSEDNYASILNRFDVRADGEASLMINDKSYKLFGEHNKPTGSYTGNGSSVQRNINTGEGIGDILFIHSEYGNVLVFNDGAIVHNMDDIWATSNVSYLDGVLCIETSDETLNANGKKYSYRLL